MLRTGGQAVVDVLKANAVETVFGMPGVHNLAVYDALLDSGIRHLSARHEQGAAFMADGYARASGDIGVCLCTSGPALLNTATSLGTAYSDSSPVLCVASQIPLDAVGREKGYIHECRDQLACVEAVTGWSGSASTVAAVPELLHEAIVQMRSGRPRPVAVEIPCDVLDAESDIRQSSCVPVDIPRRQPEDTQISAAVDLLSQARRPLIWVGGGMIISGGHDELVGLAEHIQAPVFSTVLGKGAIPGDHPLSAGSAMVHPAAKPLLDSCDCLLAIGTRFTQEETLDWTLPIPESLIHIDIDQNECGRNYRPAVFVHGDARQSLRALNAQMARLPARDEPQRRIEVAEMRNRIVDDCRQIAPQGVQLVETLRDALPRETVVVSDLTLAAYWCRRLLDIFEPRTNIYPWGFCTLGFGVPAAIGAKAARPDRPVVLLSGDGGFQFNNQELAVAVECQLPIVVLLFNNSGYGVLQPQQQLRYGRSLGAELRNPDFVALARAYGAESRQVTRCTDLGPAVQTAVASGQTWVLEITFPVPLPVMEPAMQALHAAQ